MVSILHWGVLGQVFDTTGKNGESIKVAGTSVTTGKLSRQYSFRVIRGEQVLREGLTVFSMRRFKDRVNEVDKGKVRLGYVLNSYSCLVPSISRYQLYNIIWFSKCSMKESRCSYLLSSLLSLSRTRYQPYRDHTRGARCNAIIIGGQE